MTEVPARIWVDLDQMSQGYTDKAHETTPHVVAFVPETRLLALAVAVHDMRAAQKDYFRTRTRETLIRSKEAETAVDRLLISMEARR